MKKLWLFAACFAACFPALAADDSLRVDAQSRLENIRRKAPELARGSRQVVTHVSASLQVNDATVLELLCEKPESDGRTLRLWSGAYSCAKRKKTKTYGLVWLCHLQDRVAHFIRNPALPIDQLLRGSW